MAVFRKLALMNNDLTYASCSKRLLLELHFASKNQSVLVVLLGDGLVVLGVGQVLLVGNLIDSGHFRAILGPLFFPVLK